MIDKRVGCVIIVRDGAYLVTQTFYNLQKKKKKNAPENRLNEKWAPTNTSVLSVNLY